MTDIVSSNSDSDSDKKIQLEDFAKSFIEIYKPFKLHYYKNILKYDNKKKFLDFLDFLDYNLCYYMYILYPDKYYYNKALIDAISTTKFNIDKDFFKDAIKNYNLKQQNIIKIKDNDINDKDIQSLINDTISTKPTNSETNNSETNISKSDFTEAHNILVAKYKDCKYIKIILDYYYINNTIDNNELLFVKKLLLLLDDYNYFNIYNNDIDTILDDIITDIKSIISSNNIENKTNEIDKTDEINNVKKYINLLENSEANFQDNNFLNNIDILFKKFVVISYFLIKVLDNDIDNDIYITKYISNNSLISIKTEVKNKTISESTLPSPTPSPSPPPPSPPTQPDNDWSWTPINRDFPYNNPYVIPSPPLYPYTPPPPLYPYTPPPPYNGGGGNNYSVKKAIDIFFGYLEWVNNKKFLDTVKNVYSNFKKRSLKSRLQYLIDLDKKFDKSIDNKKLSITSKELNDYKKILELLTAIKSDNYITPNDHEKLDTNYEEKLDDLIAKYSTNYTSKYEDIKKYYNDPKNSNLIFNTNKEVVIEFKNIANIFKIILKFLTIICIIISIIVLLLSTINLINLIIKIISNIVKLFYNVIVINNDTLSFKAKEIIKCTKDDYSYDIFNILNEQMTALSVFNSSIYIIYIIFAYVIIYISLVLYSMVFKFTHEFRGEIGDIDPEFNLFSIIIAIFIFSLIHLCIYKLLFKSLILPNYKNIDEYEKSLDKYIRDELNKYEINKEDDNNFFIIMSDSTRRKELNNIFADKILDLNEDNTTDIGRYLLIYDIYSYFTEYIYINEEKSKEIKEFFYKSDKSFLSYLDSHDKKLIKLYHEELDFYNEIPIEKLEYFKPINRNIGDIISKINKYIIKYDGSFFPFLLICIYIFVIFIFNMIAVYIIFEMVNLSKPSKLFPPIVYIISNKYIEFSKYLFSNNIITAILSIFKFK